MRRNWRPPNADPSTGRAKSLHELRTQRRSRRVRRYRREARFSFGDRLGEPWLSVDVQIELAHALERQWPGTAPAEDRNLMPSLIDPPVAVESLGQRQRRRARRIVRDQFGFRLRAESVELRLRIRRGELDDLEAIGTVRD